jgi:hypothetical protein
MNRRLAVCQHGVPPATGVGERPPAILPRLALIALLSAAGTLAAGQPPPPVARGLAPAEVRQRLGPPARVSRLILFRRHVEQWVYEEPRPLRIELNCVRGEEPSVCTVLQLPPGRP